MILLRVYNILAHKDGLNQVTDFSIDVFWSHSLPWIGENIIPWLGQRTWLIHAPYDEYHTMVMVPYYGAIF